MTSPGWAPTAAPGAQGGTGQDQACAGTQRLLGGPRRSPGQQGRRRECCGDPSDMPPVQAAPAAGTGREEEGLGRAGLRLPREAGRGSLSHAHSGAAFVHRLLTFPCRVTAHTDRRPTGSSVISHPPTERSLKGSGSCWGSSSEGI